MQRQGLPVPDDLHQISADGATSAKAPSRPLKESSRKTQLSQKAGHRRTPSNGLEQLLRVSEIEFLRTDVSEDHKVERKDVNRLVTDVAKAGATGASLVPQSRDEVLAAETLSSMATLGVESYAPSGFPSTHAQSQSLASNGPLSGRTSLRGIDVASSSTVTPFVVAAPSHSMGNHTSEWNGIEAGHLTTQQEDDDIEDSCVFIIERVDTGRQDGSVVNVDMRKDSMPKEDVSLSKSSAELLVGDESFGGAQNGGAKEKVCSQNVILPESYAGHPVLCNQRSLSTSTIATSSSASLTVPTQLSKATSPPHPNFEERHSVVPSRRVQSADGSLAPEAVRYVGEEEEEAGPIVAIPASAPDPMVGSKLPDLDGAPLAAQHKQRQHSNRKRNSSDEKHFLPGTKKSTVLHTESSLEECHSSTTSSPAPTNTSQETPPAAPPFSLPPLCMKPGELMPYFPMMALAAAQKGSPVPVILPPSSMAPGYFMPTVSSVGGAQPTWPPFPYYWPVTNTQVGQQQQLSNSQTFSALDLQQPAQKQPGAQFIPFMQSTIPPVGGASLTPTSVAPPFFPNHPFLLPAQLPTATDPTNSGGMSSGGSISSWKVPTTSSVTPTAGGGSGPGFRFPVVGMMMQQQLALMKARGGSAGMHQPTVSVPSSPGGLMASSSFPPLHPPPSNPGRGVPGAALGQDAAPSSSTASPLPPAVFSPPFSTVLPQMLPSMLLTGAMAPQQVIADVSCGGAAGVASASKASRKNHSKPRYQRRSNKQSAQNAVSMEGQPVVEEPSSSDASEPSAALPHPQPPKRHRGDKPAAPPRKYSRRQKDGTALKKASIDEQRLQSLLNSVVRSVGETSTTSSQSLAVIGAAPSVPQVKSEGTTKASDLSSEASSNVVDEINVIQTRTTASNAGENCVQNT